MGPEQRRLAASLLLLRCRCCQAVGAEGPHEPGRAAQGDRGPTRCVSWAFRGAGGGVKLSPVSVLRDTVCVEGGLQGKAGGQEAKEKWYKSAAQHTWAMMQGWLPGSMRKDCIGALQPAVGSGCAAAVRATGCIQPGSGYAWSALGHTLSGACCLCLLLRCCLCRLCHYGLLHKM